MIRTGTLSEYKKQWGYLKKYGIDEEYFEALYQAFRGRCGICGYPLKREVRGKGTEGRACIDHDHKTGNIRGILCHRCNSGLGLFRDSVELLQKAKEYLQ
jgi:hypothetical protein